MSTKKLQQESNIVYFVGKNLDTYHSLTPSIHHPVTFT